MSTPTLSLDKVTNQLIQQKKRLLQMAELLSEELTAVKDRNGVTLSDIAKQKEAQLTAIANADSQLSSDEVKQLITTTPSLTDIAQEIKTLLEQCQQKNEVIYLTATQNQVAIEQVKRLLVGGSKNTTYDAYGQKKSISSTGRGIKA